MESWSSSGSAWVIRYASCERGPEPSCWSTSPTLPSCAPCFRGGLPIWGISRWYRTWSICGSTGRSMVGSRPSAVLVCTPGYQRFYPAAEAALGVAIGALVRNVQINENTHYLRSKIWLTDIVENLPQTVGTTPFLALEGKYQGVPAFIVGAGPSLNKNGPALREATKKGIVIAVNTSGKALVRHGVTPHVLACIESIDLSHDLAGLPFIDEVVRAFSLSGSPAHFATGKGPLLPIVENLPTFEPLVSLLGQRGLAVGASVTTAALSLAHRLGCSPIVLVGQDLAFTGNQVYAQGTSYEGSQVRIAKSGGRVEHAWSEEAQRSHGTRVGALPTSEPLLETMAWGGERTVATSAGFTAVRNWLEAAADLMQRSSPHLRLINATEGGARIENFEELTLAEVLRDFSDRHLTSAHLRDAADATGGCITAQRLTAWAQEQLRLVKRAGRAGPARRAPGHPRHRPCRAGRSARDSPRFQAPRTRRNGDEKALFGAAVRRSVGYPRNPARFGPGGRDVDREQLARRGAACASHRGPPFGSHRPCRARARRQTTPSHESVRRKRSREGLSLLRPDRSPSAQGNYASPAAKKVSAYLQEGESHHGTRNTDQRRVPRSPEEPQHGFEGARHELQSVVERFPHQHRRRRRCRVGNQRQLPRSNSLVLSSRAQRERRYLDGADR